MVVGGGFLVRLRVGGGPAGGVGFVSGDGVGLGVCGGGSVGVLWESLGVGVGSPLGGSAVARACHRVVPMLSIWPPSHLSLVRSSR